MAEMPQASQAPEEESTMINMAILGAGNIARTMASTITQMKGEVNAYAVASRDAQKAAAFAAEFGFETSYGSYEEMLADAAVDLVYVALPHSHHHRWTLACLEAGKNVLCEKSFAVNEAQAREMVRLSEEKGLLLTEAIWPRYMPSRKMITDLIEEGCIGKVETVSASLDFSISNVVRLNKPELAGGALLDLGVYALNFASMVMGNDIRRIAAFCIKTETGVDAKESIFIEYEGGRMACLYTSMTDSSNNIGCICGTEGYLEIDDIINPAVISVCRQGTNGTEKKMVLRSVKVPAQITGYEYEVRAAIRAIKAGKTECEEMPHAETLEIMRQMDECRRQFGVVYPME